MTCGLSAVFIGVPWFLVWSVNHATLSKCAGFLPRMLQIEDFQQFVILEANPTAAICPSEL
jgi:hypothetical protein